MPTEVEDLIEKQSTANQNLEMLTENTEVFEAILAETKKSNVFSEDSRALVPFTGGLGAITPEVLPANNGALELLIGIADNQDKSVLLLDSINDGIMKLVGSAATEALEVAGATVDRQGETDDLLDDGMGDLVGGLGGGVLAGFSSKIIGALGTAASVAIPLAIGAAMVGFGKGMFDVFSKDEVLAKITDKARSDLSAAEETFAAFAQGLEVISFGFFNAKETFDVVQPLANKFQEGIDLLFDPETGVFGEFVTGFFKLIDGDLLGGGKDILAAFTTLPSKMLGGVLRFVKGTSEILVDLFAPESLIGPLKQGITNSFGPLISLFSNDIPSIISDGVWTSVDGILNNFKMLFGSITDTIKEVFTSTLTEDQLSSITSTYDETVDAITNMLSKVTSFFTDMASSVRNYIGENLESLVSKLPDFLQSDTLSSIVSSIKGGSNEEVTPIQKPKSLDNAVLKPESGLNIPAVKSPPIEASKATALSKERLDAQQVNVNVSSPPPVVIQKETREKKILVRKKSHDDLNLAISGMGAM